MLALMSTSIPHVSWVYQQFELGNSLNVNVWFTTINIQDITTNGIAIGIDALAAWLVFSITFGGKRGNAAIWVFITALVGLSWYCNYIYAMAHNAAIHVDVWSITILFGYTTTGFITPIIISSIPLFTVAYAVMWLQISKTQNSVSLANEATRLETVNRDKARIRNAKRENRQAAFTGLVSDFKHVMNEIKPAKSTLVENTPVENTSLENTSVENTSVENIVKETYMEDAYSDNMHTEETYVPVQRNLDMVESAMVNALNDLPETELHELRILASSQTLSNFTQTLKNKYPAYKSYITPNRVSNVLDVMGVTISVVDTPVTSERDTDKLIPVVTPVQETNDNPITAYLAEIYQS